MKRTANGHEYDEIIEDAALAKALDSDPGVTFQVIEDEWSADYKTRIIKSAQLISGGLDAVQLHQPGHAS